MSKQEAREARINEWLDHLRRCEAAGGSLASYAKQQGMAEWKLYQWRRRLIREGRWPAENGQASSVSPRRRAALRFARVAVTASPPMCVVRLQLGNGRRAEIEMTQIDSLIDLLGALEQQS